ncbi:MULTISPECIES: tyrosine-type recombinase/integrase [unclassified Ruegeria]|uniref:tyrosine-type recombinase/integrase n=1 Tax=unclassified Ruegeria TaxID=2625375 RepID=UPI00148991C4|nr:MULTISPECIES: tyrosine-type recombinase/integrase [unclassified Ruegeria]
MTLFLLIGLLTGQRKEAILFLRCSNVDFYSNIIYWNPVGRRRTKKECPSSRLPARLKKHLIPRRRRFPEDEFIVTNSGKSLQNIKLAFRTSVVAAGLETGGDLKVVPHTLRHTCATWLMQQGAPKWDACGFLGMTLETPKKNYGHHNPDHQRGAADAI